MHVNMVYLVRWLSTDYGPSKKARMTKHLIYDCFDSVWISSRSLVWLKRSFERAISHYDVIVVVVMIELFTNVVCKMAMLLPRILVLPQQINDVLCM